MKKQVSAVVPNRSSRERARQQAADLHATLERHIDQGRLKPGEKIATERELAIQFGASRTVVRNALEQLHKAGKITRKVGHGTIVLAQPGHQPMLSPGPLLDTSPAELMEFRLALEPSLAEAIVLNASERDISAIRDCVDGGDAADGWEEWERWDRSFHLSLVAATHNRLAIGVYEAIISIRHERPWLHIKQGHTDARRWQIYQEQHRWIVDRLAERDAKGAAEAIRDHLLRVRAKMLGAADAPP
jgi:DNA-binding FadR family transcriptional regulator